MSIHYAKMWFPWLQKYKLIVYAILIVVYVKMV